MAEWILGVVALVICFHNTVAEIVLTQSPSISTSSGQSVKITCTVAGGNIESYSASWYWQKPGSAPALVWDGYGGMASGIPDRFNGSVDSSSNQMHLTIANVQSEDVADYYCGVWTCGMMNFGKGTKLNFGNTLPPEVLVLPPSTEEITRNGTATLVCLLSGFKPGAVDIEWTVDGSPRKNGVESSRVQQEADNTFSSSSYLTLRASDWKAHDLYTCVVKHEAQANPVKVNVARSGCL
ncbi:immunoglobulin lambda-1 light chain-like [Hypanus sabinus]|uniref:immunoglobulin lambda-1 light chain-like n=1 Tax=Hypanus sabinus TaxID=79690 RepID=UPI0028C4CA25|nr:immunoglobulin lambda-1 light chain-like [Hypanus sabinus]